MLDTRTEDVLLTADARVVCLEPRVSFADVVLESRTAERDAEALDDIGESEVFSHVRPQHRLASLAHWWEIVSTSMA